MDDDMQAVVTMISRMRGKEDASRKKRQKVLSDTQQLFESSIHEYKEAAEREYKTSCNGIRQATRQVEKRLEEERVKLRELVSRFTSDLTSISQGIHDTEKMQKQLVFKAKDRMEALGKKQKAAAAKLQEQLAAKLAEADREMADIAKAAKSMGALRQSIGKLFDGDSDEGNSPALDALLDGDADDLLLPGVMGKPEQSGPTPAADTSKQGVSDDGGIEDGAILDLAALSPLQAE